MRVNVMKATHGFHVKVTFCCVDMRNFVNQHELTLFKSNHDLRSLIGETEFIPQHNFKYCPFCGEGDPLVLDHAYT